MRAVTYHRAPSVRSYKPHPAPAADVQFPVGARRRGATCHISSRPFGALLHTSSRPCGGRPIPCGSTPQWCNLSHTIAPLRCAPTYLIPPLRRTSNSLWEHTTGVRPATYIAPLWCAPTYLIPPLRRTSNFLWEHTAGVRPATYIAPLRCAPTCHRPAIRRGRLPAGSRRDPPSSSASCLPSVSPATSSCVWRRRRSTWPARSCAAP